MADPALQGSDITIAAHSSTSIVLDYVGAADGDLLLAFIHWDGSTGGITLPSGNVEDWSIWQSQNHSGSFTGILWLVANGEGTDPSFTFSWTDGQGAVGIACIVRDADNDYDHSDTSWQGQAAWEDEASATSYTTPSVTTDTDGELVFITAGTDDAASSGFETATNSFTVAQNDRSGTGNNNVRLAVGYKTQTSAGSVGTSTWANLSVARAGMTGMFSIEHAPAGSGTTVTPGVVATTTAVPGPTVTATADIQPGAVATVVATPAPTVTATADIDAGAVSLVTAIPSPTVTTAVTPTPGVVATTIATPSPTVTATADVQAGVVATSTAVPGPTVVADADVSAGVVATTVATPAPTVTATADVPSAAVASVVAVPGPTVTATADVAAGVVATTVAVPAASPVVGTFIFPDPVAVSVAVPGPTINADTTIAAAAVATVIAIPAPTVSVVEGEGEGSDKEWPYWYLYRRKDLR
jgi:hypothetical protein